MPLTVYHALTATTPDDPAAEIRPSHWNETHSASLNAVGSEIVGAFSNGGGVTFGLETNGYITASAPAGGGGLTNINISAGTTSQNLSALTFSDGNGVSFGLNGSVITGTVATNYAASNHSHGNPTLNLTNLSGTTASASNGLTLSLSAASQTVQTQNMVSVQGSTGAISFGNANGITFGFNASTITASHNGLTSQSNQAFSAGGGSSTFQTLSFSNGGGVTFTNTNGQVGASVATTYRASNDAIGLNTAQSNVTWTANSSGISLDARGYAGTGTTFAGANLSASMTLNSNGLNLSMSAAAPGGGAAINVSAGTTSNNLQTIQFNNANGVTFGLNGSTITASVNAGAAVQRSFWQPLPPNTTATLAPVGAGTIHVWPAFNADPNSATRAIYYISNSVSSSSNSSHAGVISLHVGLYTRNGSTLSLASSGSQSYQWTNTSNNSLASISGIRGLTVPIDVNHTGGDVWVAVMSRTSTTNANWFTARNIIVTGLTNQLVGNIGEATNVSRQILPGWGQYSTTSSALPSSMAFTDLRGQGSGAAAVGAAHYMAFANVTA